MSEAYPLDADMLGNVIQDAVGDMNEGDPLTAKQWEYIGRRALEATAYAEMLSALKALSHAFLDERESQIGRELKAGDLPRVWHRAEAAIALAEGRAQ